MEVQMLKLWIREYPEDFASVQADPSPPPYMNPLYPPLLPLSPPNVPSLAQPLVDEYKKETQLLNKLHILDKLLAYPMSDEARDYWYLTKIGTLKNYLLYNPAVGPSTPELETRKLELWQALWDGLDSEDLKKLGDIWPLKALEKLQLQYQEEQRNIMKLYLLDRIFEYWDSMDPSMRYYYIVEKLRQLHQYVFETPHSSPEWADRKQELLKACESILQDPTFSLEIRKELPDIIKRIHKL